MPVSVTVTDNTKTVQVTRQETLGSGAARWGTVLGSPSDNTDLTNYIQLLSSQNGHSSAAWAHLKIKGNAVATTIALVDTPVQIEGVPTYSVVQGFTLTGNAFQYTLADTRVFNIRAVATCIAGNNETIGIYVAKNGVVIPQSSSYKTTGGGGGVLENIVLDHVDSIAQNDIMSIHVENTSAAQDVIVSDISISILSA